jgi:signal transduction histidine kinase
VNLLTKLVDLSFEVLRKQSAGHDELQEVLSVLQQQLNINTLGLFIWDAELTVVYPLGLQGSDSKILTEYVNKNETSFWDNQSLSLAAQLDAQIDTELPESIPVALPLWSQGERLGVLSFLWTKQADLSLLDEVSTKVNDFLISVNIVRKNRLLEKKSLELIQTQNSLKNTLKISTSVQNQLEDMAAKLKIEAAKSKKANRAKSEFLSSMSHELRTPLNIILGFSQLIKNTNLTEDQRENISEVLSAGEHLLDMVNEVLELSRIEGGELDINLSEVDLFDLINRVVILMGPLAHKYNVSLINQVEDNGQKVIIDEIKLKQVLVNLLSNAAKYNKYNGSITIRANIKDNAELKLEVIDTGNGILDEHLEHAFQAFERLAITNGSIEGVGVGLAICKSLVETMGGQIGVDSSLGQGSCFWVNIPLKQT